MEWQIIYGFYINYIWIESTGLAKLDAGVKGMSRIKDDSQVPGTLPGGKWLILLQLETNNFW